MKKNLLFVIIVLSTSVAYADTGASGISDAAGGVATYMPYVRALCYVIAAIIAIVGAVAVYIGMHTQPQQTTKRIMVSVGSCLCFVCLSFALPHGNVSAGTSDFAMLVTDKKLNVHTEIDMVTTPDGMPVAMVHCNNCTSDINAWVDLFEEFAKAIGANVDKGDLYTLLFNKAMEGDPAGGGLLNYNYFSGESITNLDEGRPLFTRALNCDFNLANFMRVQIMSSLATLKIGLDILTLEEKVTVDKLYGHGGLFKTPGVGQTLLSAAIGAPVSVMETAGEGGPYGMALLCAYMLWKEEGESLPDYLDNKVFAGAPSSTILADEKDQKGFAQFLEIYRKGLAIERAAVENI